MSCEAASLPGQSQDPTGLIISAFALKGKSGKPITNASVVVAQAHPEESRLK